MNNILTIRIDEQMKRIITHLARHKGISRSEVVREAIVTLGAASPKSREKSAFAAAAELIGCYRSGGRNRSWQTGRQFRAALKRRRKK